MEGSGREDRDLDGLQEKLVEMKLTYSSALLELDRLTAEREGMRELQKATLGLLEDVEAERERSHDVQLALLNILEDVEEERNKVESTKAQLESVNQELEAFSYSVSHDLRAPLRAISGFSQAVLDDYLPILDDEGKKYLKLIQENAAHMGLLIDELLDFSRLGRHPLRMIDVNIEEIARIVFDELMAQEPARHVELVIHPLPPARGDASMLRQVMFNLFSNAFKFTRTRKDAVIEVGFIPGAEGGSYFVKDNGVGFDMMYVNRIFSVFQRLHPATEFEGTGVGLAIVKRIIDRHGGRVWAEGYVDLGATFYFTLPEVDRDGGR
ncbi:MAG: hypothetical protein ISF22_03920 [Methanomassiliicoccus sp.]|nr:hypothetical protein [Methanomassiliicoccus sp.]